MPAVFVHGNPECDAVWRPLVDALERTDITLLSPPGFGAPTPSDWSATRVEYRDWLIEQLTAIDEPIDLVGHDWGGGHVLAAVVARPELVRTWCVDVLGISHPDYVWHDTARIWQTEGAGEAHIEQMIAASPSMMAPMYESMGLPPDVASDVAGALDTEMGRCVLALYRGALTPGPTRRADLPRARAAPGLAIVAQDDPFVGDERLTMQLATEVGATVARLPGVGHWWMCQNPSLAAKTLEEFWDL